MFFFSLTPLDLLPREVGAALGGPLHHVGEADAHAEELVVVVSGHGLGREPRQVQALPCGTEQVRGRP